MAWSAWSGARAATHGRGLCVHRCARPERPASAGVRSNCRSWEPHFTYRHTRPRPARTFRRRGRARPEVPAVGAGPTPAPPESSGSYRASGGGLQGLPRACACDGGLRARPGGAIAASGRARREVVSPRGDGRSRGSGAGGRRVSARRPSASAAAQQQQRKRERADRVPCGQTGDMFTHLQWRACWQKSRNSLWP